MSDKVDILGRYRGCPIPQACAEQCGLSQYDLASCLALHPAQCLALWDLPTQHPHHDPGSQQGGAGKGLAPVVEAGDDLHDREDDHL